jgi:predicted MFS family arabinose efflux permease
MTLVVPDSMIRGSGRPAGQRFPGYGLYLLLAVYTMCFLDRQVINILAEPIKKDLGLTDAQLGLLTGLSFALFYTALGIPIARLSEFKNRSSIMVGCLAIWSGFTMLCALAGNMAWLLVTRIGVGFGEAGCFPACQSMISEYLPPAKRAWSLSILMMGAPLGLLLGMVIGGFVAERYGWRGAFVAAGAPGLLLAALVRFLLPDPSRASHKAILIPPPSFGTTVRELAQRKGFWSVIAGMSFAAFVTYSQNAFVASFFLRVYSTDLAGLTQNRGAVGYIGIALGLILGLGGAAGLLLGGCLGDRLGRGNTRGYLTVASSACVLAAPVFLCVFGIHSLSLAFALLVPATILSNVWAGPAYAVLQSMAHERSRATAAAIAVLFLTLFGLGLGPLSVGALSDHLARSLGTAEGLRWALMATAGMSVLSSMAFWLARRQMESGPFRVLEAAVNNR